MGRIQSNIGLSNGNGYSTDDRSTVIDLVRSSSSFGSSRQGLSSQQVVLNELTALVLGVQMQTNRLGTKANISSVTSTSSAPEVIKVTTSGTPPTGSYAIQAIQTAQTSAAASNAFTSVSDKLEAGELVIRTADLSTVRHSLLNYEVEVVSRAARFRSPIAAERVARSI